MGTSAPSSRPPRFRRGLYFSSTGTIVSIAALFLETMIAVRFLSRIDFGIYALLTTFVMFMIIVVDLGSKTAVTQLIASSNQARQAALANSAIVFRVLMVGLVSLLIWFGRHLPFVLDSALLPYLVYIPAMLIVASLDELFLGILQGFRIYRHLATTQIMRSVLRLCLTPFLLVVFDLGLMALIYSWIISFTASLVYQYLVIPIPKRFRFQQPLLKEILRFGMPLHMVRFLSLALRRVDVFLLWTFVGPAGVAVYTVATRIPEAFQRVFESFAVVYLPTMSSLLSEGKREQAQALLNDSLRLISFATASIVLIATVFNQQIITLLFSDKYQESGIVFAVLMLALHMIVLFSLMGYTQTASGNPLRALGGSLFRTTLHVIGSLLLIPLFGALGSAYAALAASYTANPVAVWLLRRSQLSVAVSAYAKTTLILLLSAGLALWFEPTWFVYKLAIIGLFCGLNLGFSTISLQDLNLVLPARVMRRLGLQQEAMAQ